MTDNQFFSINHMEHFRAGLCYNLDTSGDSISFLEQGEALFISHSYDSCGHSWHRAQMDIDCGEAWFALSFYASDTKQITMSDGTVCDLDMLIKTDLLNSREKAELLRKTDIWTIMPANAPDILLHGLYGRYLWVMLEVRGSVFPKLSRIRLYYPAASFQRYLPESYQDTDNSFWVRFIAMFQSLYLDVDEEIAVFPSELNPRSASENALTFMSEWLGFSHLWELGADTMRMLVEHAAKLYRRWGTRQCLEEILSLICGQKPYIIEHFMSGGNPFGFTVLLRGDGVAVKHQKLIKSVIDSLKPVHASYDFILLKDAVILDSHCYLNVNSRLSDYPQFKIDGCTPLYVYSI